MTAIYADHPAVIARLQHLTHTSFAHNLKDHLLHTPTPANLQTVRTAESSHKSSVASELSHITQLVRDQEQLIAELRSKIEDIKNSKRGKKVLERAAEKNKDGQDGGEKNKLLELCRLKAEKEAAEAEYYRDTPYVPSPDSGLNVLITVKGIVEVVEGFRSEVGELERRVENAETRLKREGRWVEDAKEIQIELERKIKELEKASSSSRGKKEDAIIVENKRIAEFEKQKKDMSQKSARLAKDLAKFVKESLGLMIAVEEAGGPVVGNELGVETLRGYLEFEEGTGTGSLRGKAKKSRERGQKRLDEIWGAAGGGYEHVDAEKAAGQELLELIEAMMNTTLDEDVYAYTNLPRDSAASRFLIRSFVAQFHPKDALKIRLVDFAGRIEDAV